MSSSDETSAAQTGPATQPVRLKEDLLYLINKKLKSIEKAERDEPLKDYNDENEDRRKFYEANFGADSTLPNEGREIPFTGVSYRKKPGFSETQLAVMNKAYLNFNSIAICKIDTMERFLEMTREWSDEMIKTSYFDMGCWDFDSDDESDHKQKVNEMFEEIWEWSGSYWARFIQLPKDYSDGPQSDCVFFEELARDENGTPTVDVKQFSLCLAIYKLKQWLTWPSKYKYPFDCFGFFSFKYTDCQCKKILAVVFTDKLLRSFFEKRGIEWNYLTDNNDIDDWRPDEMKAAASDMRNYSNKLMTGEEMICPSNRALNVLCATQVFKIAGKVDVAIDCISQGSPKKLDPL